MKILVDTNIIIDWVTVREPFATLSKKVMEECMFGKTEGYLAAHTITDIFYILRKDFNVADRKELLTLLCKKFIIIAENKQMILNALGNEQWNDIEDGLQMQCAIDMKLDYIITRNLKDFQSSKIRAINAEEFLSYI